jgi:heme exporter protein D
MWSSWPEFFSMGGYALYVWPSFGLTALIFVIEPLLTVFRRKAAIARIRCEIDAERFDSKGML